MADGDYTSAVNEALAASAALHAEIQKCIVASSTPSVKTLKAWRTLNKTTNQKMRTATRKFWDNENRIIIEKNTIRGLIRKERLDREANSARVFDKLRTYSTHGQLDIDRILARASQVQTLVNSLAPVQPTTFHGAAWLALDLLTDKDKLQHLVKDTKP